MADLATVAGVKAYLGLTSSNQDALIAALITRESSVIESYLSRSIAGQAFTKQRLDGTGTQRLTLPADPVLLVSFLSIDNVEVQPSPDGLAAGYLYDDLVVTVLGQVFPRRPLCVQASWTTGYVGAETDFVPAANVPTLTPSSGGRAIAVSSCVYTANGAAFTQVGNAPAAGQFTFSGGTFTFAAADSGKQVSLTCYVVPSGVEQACIEMVALDMKQRENLGINSRSIAGESVSYTNKGMPDTVKEALLPWRKVIPTRL